MLISFVGRPRLCGGRPWLSSAWSRGSVARYEVRQVPAREPARREVLRRVCGAAGGGGRSEERRVGKECRCRWSAYYYKKKVDSGFENQKGLTKMQLDNQKYIAEMQNETQKEIAGIQSSTSRQNTKNQVYAQNEMVPYPKT